MMLTEKEARLIEIIRKLDFGEVRIVIQDCVPTRIEEIKRSIKLQLKLKKFIMSQAETDWKTGGFLPGACFYVHQAGSLFFDGCTKHRQSEAIRRP